MIPPESQSQVPSTARSLPATHHSLLAPPMLAWRSRRVLITTADSWLQSRGQTLSLSHPPIPPRLTCWSWPARLWWWRWPLGVSGSRAGSPSMSGPRCSGRYSPGWSPRTRLCRPASRAGSCPAGRRALRRRCWGGTAGQTGRGRGRLTGRTSSDKSVDLGKQYCLYIIKSEVVKKMSCVRLTLKLCLFVFALPCVLCMYVLTLTTFNLRIYLQKIVLIFISFMSQDETK